LEKERLKELSKERQKEEGGLGRTRKRQHMPGEDNSEGTSDDLSSDSEDEIDDLGLHFYQSIFICD
jgi:hypothetical protein